MTEQRDISFTRFLPPHGQQVQVMVARPVEIADIADQITDRGGRLTVEMLSTGVISLACEYQDEDIAQGLAENGPPLMAEVDRVIKEAWEEIQNRDKGEE
jgi:hypothetical protein